MLSETFITSILAQPKSTNTAIAKDVGIYVHELHPTHAIKSSFKKSSTRVNALAATSTHIFAAQADKAVVHVYSRERGNQEALISFPERISALGLVGHAVLALGTAGGRIILWEISTGRQISTADKHLQAVSCIVASNSPSHLISGSEDANIHVWSIPRLLSLTQLGSPEPLRSLSNHRSAVTSLAMGHSSSTTNICVSASKDNTVIVWNYNSGELLRTFLLPSTPLCLALDPCDRAVYVGFEDGSLQPIDFIQPDSTTNPLYDTALQTTPVQVTAAPWTSQSVLGAALCISLSYDGTSLVTGHDSGKLVQWDTGRHRISAELADLNAPVTNLELFSPFQSQNLTKVSSVVKPKIGEGNYTMTVQLTRSFGTSNFDCALESLGVPTELLNDAISRVSRSPSDTSHPGSEELRRENEELWKVVNEQRALQKRTWEKYNELKSEEI